MHTFFINTAAALSEQYGHIFEIQREIKQFVALDCPMAKWNDEKEGYRECVRKMGELIDSDKAINNSYNLIVYLDLWAYDLYTQIPMENHRERYACLKALRSVLKHFINKTLIEELNACGRTPREVLIIFEENRLPQDSDELTEDGKALLRSYTAQCLGVPSCEELDQQGLAGKELTADTLLQALQQGSDNGLHSGMLATYDDLLDTCVRELKTYDSTQKPICNLLTAVLDSGREDDRTVSSVSFITDAFDKMGNKQARARKELRLSFYLLRCVEAQTVFETAKQDQNRQVRQFAHVDWDTVAEELTAKKEIYQKRFKETKRMSELFSEAGLAPQLYALDHEKFGLDPFGKKGSEWKLTDQEQEKEEQKTEDVKDENETEVVTSQVKKALTLEQTPIHPMFTQEEYAPFDYKGDDFPETLLEKNADPESYIQQAKKLRKHHLDYLKRLKMHVSEAMSHYAGRSAENVPPLLRKRTVSLADAAYTDTARDYRYTKAGKPTEKRSLDTVKQIAGDAYETVLLEYLSFCAGRSVAVTDIEEQCNWFITRVYQIRDSLRKLALVAVGMLVAILLLYVPYVVIQWKAIAESSLTLTVALCSVAIPVAILYVLYGILSALQKRKFRREWKKFKEKSDLVLEENSIAAEKYDALLCSYIPALRWLYEYKLDVEFYADCCAMARAKLNHHSEKLYQWIAAVQSILEDLEIDETQRGNVAARKDAYHNDAIDYNLSFCTGKTNRNIYSIVDSQFLDAIHQ